MNQNAKVRLTGVILLAISSANIYLSFFLPVQRAREKGGMVVLSPLGSVIALPLFLGAAALVLAPTWVARNFRKDVNGKIGRGAELFLATLILLGGLAGVILYYMTERSVGAAGYR